MSLMCRSIVSCPGLKRGVLSQFLKSNNSMAPQLRSVVLRSQPAAGGPTEDFWIKNERLNRPMSPHLTIYKPQITSMLSISHRITGIAVSGYIYGFSIGMMCLPASFPHYCAALATTSPALLVTAKFLLAFPFAYHTCNGIRHLMWDMGKGLEISQVYKTGYTMLGAASLLTLALLFL
ncbi:succinate dehydrogenase cytochrome b560 subunit, mitochondrial [Neocloeon triangulifer]|uniref:succinate dehydrogenase cytochrome b560 subunit, mitochondrial n=1 Tax=Neocloeon triangulifer TaxID=2078957 RepID=UPI00286FA6FF|nr:succinate dehydrogenase cytochrome b560 subunit, mitochondrial [Neocloeon triangulifer]XP_059469741.1 succinate dehydrogenase cytochrome b560 subunit, mitochondrial [Neocloeon triangulifer]